MDNDLISVMEAFMAVNNKIYQIKDESITFSNGIKLKTGAIHLVEAIGNHPLSNVTTLATKLGVTKGAVSQQISKLMKKGLVSATRRPENQKDIVLQLLPAGNVIFHEHAQAHEELYRVLSEKVLNFSVDDREKMIELFELVGQYVDEYRQGFI
ncbi:MarR family transcriptional regulator [Clostridium sp. KNHs205]|jgi:MarR family transcriptional regulator, teicoplanin-associated locus regulator|uniref:MarR family transcriptional regulator n=1 Tax=Clostridium sp. KNHs205 TaxID=1449050 RepID=UPI00051B3CEC|nr:MarR family transcriptional regulator [Clostridium sp. KNHs205]